MKSKCKKTKTQRVQDALDALNKAMQTKEPHLRIELQGGLSDRSSEDKEFVAAVKTFIQAYKKFYRLEKVEVDFIL